MTTPIKCTVLPGEPKQRDGDFTNERGENVKYSKTTQATRLEVNGFAYPYDVRLEKGQPPYPPGDYTLDLAAMLQINKGSHSLSKYAVLRPLKG